MINKEYGNIGTNVGYFYFGITTAVFALTLLRSGNWQIQLGTD